VGDECSGLTAALALLALGTFIACSARELPGRRRALLVVLALPVALIANMARVTLLAAIGRLSGPAAVDSWHTASAVMVYAIAIAAYVGLERRLRVRAAEGTST
jgi:exosortase/archaeosortase family protein